jgi:hypothetical protein
VPVETDPVASCILKRLSCCNAATKMNIWAKVKDMTAVKALMSGRPGVWVVFGTWATPQ